MERRVYGRDTHARPVPRRRADHVIACDTAVDPGDCTFARWSVPPRRAGCSGRGDARCGCEPRHDALGDVVETWVVGAGADFAGEATKMVGVPRTPRVREHDHGRSALDGRLRDGIDVLGVRYSWHGRSFLPAGRSQQPTRHVSRCTRERTHPDGISRCVGSILVLNGDEVVDTQANARLKRRRGAIFRESWRRMLPPRTSRPQREGRGLPRQGWRRWS